MAEQTPTPQSALPSHMRVQYALVFLAGASAALIGHRIVQSRTTHPPESFRAESVANPSQTPSPTEPKSAKPLPTKRIDLNHAQRHELMQLPGVGPATADGILAFRDTNGPFQRLEELRGIRGIGANTVERLRPWLIIDSADGDEPIRLARRNAESTKSTRSGKSELDGPLDINKATAAQMECLPGIGPTLAQRIVDEREKKPFASVDDLKRVYGIGPKKLEQARPFVTVHP
jgi:competence protein ComEA